MASGPTLKQYLVEPGSKVRLGKIDPSDASGFKGGKKEGEKAINSLIGKLDPLQELLYAEHKHS
jgi:hypothetical protein